jgi:hypothetical protein
MQIGEGARCQSRVPHTSIALLWNSVPLSTVIETGAPRSATISGSAKRNLGRLASRRPAMSDTLSSTVSTRNRRRAAVADEIHAHALARPDRLVGKLIFRRALGISFRAYNKTSSTVQSFPAP